MPRLASLAFVDPKICICICLIKPAVPSPSFGFYRCCQASFAKTPRILPSKTGDKSAKKKSYTAFLAAASAASALPVLHIAAAAAAAPLVSAPVTPPARPARAGHPTRPIAAPASLSPLCAACLLLTRSPPRLLAGPESALSNTANRGRASALASSLARCNPSAAGFGLPNMSLARAVTKRGKKIEIPPTAPPPPVRSQSTKTVDRAKISSPVALLSATNNMVYDAPNLPAHTLASASPSSDDSDHSASTLRSRASSHRSNDTLTDASSVSSAASPKSPPPNHLSEYFAAANMAQTRRSATSHQKAIHRKSLSSDATVPAIPDRALSHSKRAHERVAQKRSMQNMRAPQSQAPHARDATRTPPHQHHHHHQPRQHHSHNSEQRLSADMFRAAAASPDEGGHHHPFGRELEQLNEVAEEFGGVVRDVETEEDVAAMRRCGLAKYCAADYLLDLAPSYSNPFWPVFAQPPMAWI